MDVKGYEGYYQVSNVGRVKSLARNVGKSSGSKTYTQFVQEKILNPYRKTNGYLAVRFSRNGKGFEKTIHRLVADAFIENPKRYKEVNHIDGNKVNNHYSNLEWVTQRENMLHAANILGVGLGENSGNAIYTEDQIHSVCKLLELGHINKDVSDVTGVKQHTVSLVRKGVAWKQISCMYKIPKRSRTFSDSTVKWICRMLEQKLSTKQILEMSTNPRLTKSMVDDIRIGRVYSYISKEFAI